MPSWFNAFGFGNSSSQSPPVDPEQLWITPKGTKTHDALPQATENSQETIASTQSEDTLIPPTPLSKKRPGRPARVKDSTDQGNVVVKPALATNGDNDAQHTPRQQDAEGGDGEDQKKGKRKRKSAPDSASSTKRRKKDDDTPNEKRDTPSRPPTDAATLAEHQRLLDERNAQKAAEKEAAAKQAAAKEAAAQEAAAKKAALKEAAAKKAAAVEAAAKEAAARDAAAKENATKDTTAKSATGAPVDEQQPTDTVSSRDIDMSDQANSQAPNASALSQSEIGPHNNVSSEQTQTPTSNIGKRKKRAFHSVESDVEEAVATIKEIAPFEGEEYPESGLMIVEETAMLQKFLENFRNANDMSEADLKKLIAGRSRPANEFWEQIFELFPRRKREAVRKTVRRKYHLQHHGKWTPEEDEALRKAHQDHPSEWIKISKLLERTANDCRDRWRNYLTYGSNRKMHRWTEQEELDLSQAVEECMEEAREKEMEKAEKEGVPFVEKDWEKKVNFFTVSEKMDMTRSRIQCLQHWKRLKKKDAEAEASKGTSIVPPKKPSSALSKQPNWRDIRAKRTYRTLSTEQKLELLRQIEQSGTFTAERIPWYEMKIDFANRTLESLDYRIFYQKMLGHLREQPATLKDSIIALREYFESADQDKDGHSTLSANYVVHSSEDEDGDGSQVAQIENRAGNEVGTEQESKEREIAEEDDENEEDSDDSEDEDDESEDEDDEEEDQNMSNSAQNATNEQGVSLPQASSSNEFTTNLEPTDVVMADAPDTNQPVKSDSEYESESESSSDDDTDDERMDIDDRVPETEPTEKKAEQMKPVEKNNDATQEAPSKTQATASSGSDTSDGESESSSDSESGDETNEDSAKQPAQPQIATTAPESEDSSDSDDVNEDNVKQLIQPQIAATASESEDSSDSDDASQHGELEHTRPKQLTVTPSESDESSENEDVGESAVAQSTEQKSAAVPKTNESSDDSSSESESSDDNSSEDEDSDNDNIKKTETQIVNKPLVPTPPAPAKRVDVASSDSGGDSSSDDSSDEASENGVPLNNEKPKSMVPPKPTQQTRSASVSSSSGESSSGAESEKGKGASITKKAQARETAKPQVTQTAKPQASEPTKPQAAKPTKPQASEPSKPTQPSRRDNSSSSSSASDSDDSSDDSSDDNAPTTKAKLKPQPQAPPKQPAKPQQRSGPVNNDSSSDSSDGDVPATKAKPKPQPQAPPKQQVTPQQRSRPVNNNNNSSNDSSESEEEEVPAIYRQVEAPPRKPAPETESSDSDSSDSDSEDDSESD